MALTFQVEARRLPSFHEVLAGASLHEPLQLAGAGWTGEPWPRGLLVNVADASAVASAVELTPELEATFARAGLSASFLAFVRSSARGVVVTRTPTGITFSVLALASPADYALAVRLATTTTRAATAGTAATLRVVEAEGTGPGEAVSADDALARFDPTWAEDHARRIGTWLAEDVAAGRTYFFQGPRGWSRLTPDDLRDVPREQRFARARALVLGEAVHAPEPRRTAVLLTAAMVFAAGADGRLDEEEARQLEAHFATVRELAVFPARELLDAVKTDVSGIEALRELSSPALRKKAFVLAAEVIASARGGQLTGAADDPNVQAVSALAIALGLDGDQPFIARVVTAVMTKYASAGVDDVSARTLVLGMLLAAAADGRVDDDEAALLSALARTVPELRARDVTALFAAARARMDAGLDAALADLAALPAGAAELTEPTPIARARDKCFALAAEVALVAGRGPGGTMLPRLRDHIAPDASSADCAITTFAAKYAGA